MESREFLKRSLADADSGKTRPMRAAILTLGQKGKDGKKPACPADESTRAQKDGQQKGVDNV